MTPDELRICNVVDTLIRKNRSFALWRIPGESPRFAMQTSGSARILYHIEELDEQSGFVIAPFHVSKQIHFYIFGRTCCIFMGIQILCICTFSDGAFYISAQVDPFIFLLKIFHFLFLYKRMGAKTCINIKVTEAVFSLILSRIS